MPGSCLHQNCSVSGLGKSSTGHNEKKRFVYWSWKPVGKRRSCLASLSVNIKGGNRDNQKALVNKSDRLGRVHVVYIYPAWKYWWCEWAWETWVLTISSECFAVMATCQDGIVKTMRNLGSVFPIDDRSYMTNAICRQNPEITFLSVWRRSKCNSHRSLSFILFVMTLWLIFPPPPTTIPLPISHTNI